MKSYKLRQFLVMNKVYRFLMIDCCMFVWEMVLSLFISYY